MPGSQRAFEVQGREEEGLGGEPGKDGEQRLQPLVLWQASGSVLGGGEGEGMRAGEWSPQVPAASWGH